MCLFSSRWQSRVSTTIGKAAAATQHNFPAVPEFTDSPFPRVVTYSERPPREFRTGFAAAAAIAIAAIAGGGERGS